MFPPGRHGNGFVVYFPYKNLQLLNITKLYINVGKYTNRQPMDGIWLPGIAKVFRLSPPKHNDGTQRKTHRFFGCTKIQSFSLPRCLAGATQFQGANAPRPGSEERRRSLDLPTTCPHRNTQDARMLVKNTRDAHFTCFGRGEFRTKPSFVTITG